MKDQAVEGILDKATTSLTQHGQPLPVHSILPAWSLEAKTESMAQLRRKKH